LFRKLYLFIFVFGLFNFSKAQDTITENSNSVVIKTDLLIPVMSLFNIGNSLESTKPNFSFSVEKFFKRRNSLQVTMIYVWPKITPIGYWPTWDTYTINDLEIIPEYKIYLTKKKIQKGSYTGVYLKYHRSHTDNSSPYPIPFGMHLEYVEHYAGFGCIFGYQFYLKKRLTLDFLARLGYAQLVSVNIKKEEYIHKGSSDYSGFLDPLLSINIGYKFSFR
jgi:hypothetical protein